MHVGWPQALYLGINILCIAIIGGTPPEKRTPPSPVGITLMWITVTLPLLYWGGFFS